MLLGGSDIGIQGLARAEGEAFKAKAQSSVSNLLVTCWKGPFQKANHSLDPYSYPFLQGRTYLEAQRRQGCSIKHHSDCRFLLFPVFDALFPQPVWLPSLLPHLGIDRWVSDLELLCSVVGATRKSHLGRVPETPCFRE